MLKIFLLETALLLVGLTSSFFTWGPCTSKEMVIFFGPKPKVIPPEGITDPILDKMRQAGMRSEMVRAVTIYIFSLLAMSLFAVKIDIDVILSNSLFQGGMVAVIILAVVWNVYYGPKTFAIKHNGQFKFFSKYYFRRYLLPYWVWLPYPIVIWAGIGLITFLMIILNISDDLQNVNFYVNHFSSLSLNTVEDLQYGIIRLIQFGSWILESSQKYILVSLLIFIYAIVEQRTSMHETIMEISVERMKLAIWVGLIFTIGFALVFLPLNYESMHSELRFSIEQLSLSSPAPDSFGDILSAQISLKEHNLQWLLVKTLTGYGNLVVYFVLAFSLFVWRLYFAKFPLRLIIKLIVPKIIIKWVNNFLDILQVDIDLSKDK